MVPSDFRLDTVSVHLVERLEGARRSYVDRPEEATPAFRRIAEELVADAASEVQEYSDLPEYPASWQVLLCHSRTIAWTNSTPLCAAMAMIWPPL